MKRVAAVLGSLLTGGLLAFVGAYLMAVEKRPDLRVWHRLVPDSEATAESIGDDWALNRYLELEDRLFAQLDAAIRDEGEDRAEWGRYHSKSPTNPLRFEANWNRTFVLATEEPTGFAVMIHGLSDSPYSMRSLAQILHQQGFHVIGVRVPGHGTVPGALTEVEWEDWRAAVRVACREVAARRDTDEPFVIGGYSNGAALAVDYTLEALDEHDLPSPDRLIFLSPALAVTPLAGLARWQLLASELPFLEKLGWNSVLPEYDPYKYNSFALNAALQIFRLTSRIDDRLNRLAIDGQIDLLPPVLAFQSVVDSTVPAAASLARWFGRLMGGEDQLVLFDVNRVAQIEMFLGPAIDTLLADLQAREPHSFELTLVGNRDDRSLEIAERTWSPGSTMPSHRSLGLSWPRGIYSLSHVALPFPPDDPIYGVGASQRRPYPFGKIEARGENGVLTVPMTLLMRLRYNPFFSYLEERVVRFVAPESGEVEIRNRGAAAD